MLLQKHLQSLKGMIWSKVVASDAELQALEASLHVISTHLVGGLHEVRIYAESSPGEGFVPVDSGLEDVYFLNLSRQARKTNRRGDQMAMFWEFFSFELKFRLKSISTYVYFALWFFLSFLSIAAEDFINVGNDKVLLNGPFSTAILYILFTFFGVIVIAAIFGTSILRDFQRDTYQLLFTKPIY